jgi:hypothetical protein
LGSAPRGGDQLAVVDAGSVRESDADPMAFQKAEIEAG